MTSSSPVKPRTATTATNGWIGAVPGVVSLVLVSVVPMSGDAQEVLEISDDITCPTCVIEIGPQIALTPPMDHVWFKSVPFPNLARDGEGNYIAAPVEGDALLAVFGPDGTFRSSYGRIGEGPGEFEDGFLLLIEVGEDDVLHAIDLRYLHTLAPGAERRLDQVRMPVYTSDAVVLKGMIAVAAPVRTEAGMTTIQLLRTDGTIAASIAVAETNDERLQVAWDRSDLQRRLGRSKDHADVWSAPLNRYRVSRYGIDGEEKIRIERLSEWFEPYLHETPGAPLRAPADPTVTGIHQDANGLLWITISRAPPSFSPVIDQPVGVEVRPDPYLDYNQLLHTTVEVLDPVAGEVVARREFEEHVRLVGTAGSDVFVYSLYPDALGNLHCVVRPLNLRRE